MLGVKRGSLGHYSVLLLGVLSLSLLDLACKKKTDDTAAATIADTVGTWKSACVTFGGVDVQLTLVNTVSSGVYSYARTTDTYSASSSCATAAKLWTTAEAGTYTVGDTSGAGYALDTTLTSITLTPSAAGAVAFKQACTAIATAAGVASTATFTAGTATDLKSDVCNTNVKIAPYQILKIQDSKLYFGDTTVTGQKGLTTATRTQELASAVPFTKQ